MKPRGLCRWIGHDIDADVAINMNVTYCRRCGDDDHSNGDYEPAWIERLRSHHWWVFKAWVASACRRIRGWARCPWCGGRLGRHDPPECLPPF